MTTLAERQLSERRFHDAQAAERKRSFDVGRASLRFDDAEYLDHEPWIRPAFDALGALDGRTVLDFGCGHGMAATILARHGAHVHAFDIAPGYVNECRDRAHANGVHVDVRVADGEHLPYGDEQFDAIWGAAILHHLDLARASAELWRVLKPGGVAVFCEPWGGNPLLRWARRSLPYPGKHRTPDEMPLTRRDLSQLQIAFPDLSSTGYQLLGMLGRVGLRSRLIHQWDQTLLTRLPALQSWARYVVVTLRKPHKGGQVDFLIKKSARLN
jgi:SAM-dependent methyltransferase